MRSLPAAALCLLAACAQDLSPARRAHAEQGVRAMVQAWTLATNNRSLDTLVSLYHPGPELLVVSAEGRRTQGRDAVEAGLREWAGSAPRFNFLVDDVLVSVLSQTIAVSEFRTRLDIETGGSRQEIPGRAMLVWVRDADGAPWRIGAEHHSVQAAQPGRE